MCYSHWTCPMAIGLSKGIGTTLKLSFETEIHAESQPVFMDTCLSCIWTVYAPKYKKPAWEMMQKAVRDPPKTITWPPNSSLDTFGKQS